MSSCHWVLDMYLMLGTDGSSSVHYCRKLKSNRPRLVAIMGPMQAENLTQLI